MQAVSQSGGTTSGTGGGECLSNDKAIRLGKLVNPDDAKVIEKDPRPILCGAH